jgi:hypothetical protein
MSGNNLRQKESTEVSRFVYFFLNMIASLFFSPKVFAQTDTSLFVPIVLSSSRGNGSFFTSELTLTNRGATNVALDYTYTAAFGGGTGVASDSVPAGKQRIIPDAIDYLRGLGMPIPDSGNQGGTLSVQTHNLASPLDFGITVRTTTAEPEGRAGLAFPAVRPSEALYEPAYLFGLRQNTADRSNVALQNMGSPDQGEITLRLTVISGDPGHPLQKTLPDLTLSPGGWQQFSGILHSNGLSFSSGYVRIEPVQGTAPYYAYAVINDQANSDGSFIPPVSQQTLATQATWTLPVVVETSLFSSELIVTNLSSTPTNINLSDSRNSFSLTSLGPGEQLIIPNLIQYLRDHGITNVGSSGQPFVEALSARACINADCQQLSNSIFFGVRTSMEGEGGRYGVFYSAVPWSLSPASDVWLYDLQQDGENRTNLALVNTGENGGDANTFRINVFDGNTGQQVITIDGITVAALEWRQIGSILAQSGSQTTQGYAHVTQTSGSNPFISYAVVNDGSQPGMGTGDGAFIASSKSTYQPQLAIWGKIGFCGPSWKLRLTNALPNASIRLVSDSAGIPGGFGLPEGAKTDYQGNFSATGPNNGTTGKYNLAVDVGGARSNQVSVVIPTFDDCN